MLGKVARNTRQRNLILSELKKLTCHPTPEELYDIIKTRMPEIGISTIYRNLEKFEKEGLIEKIHGKYKRYDGNTEPHNHIKCVSCGKVQDIFFNINIDEDKLKTLGYKLKGFTLEVNGICSACQKKEGS